MMSKHTPSRRYVVNAPDTDLCAIIDGEEELFAYLRYLSANEVRGLDVYQRIDSGVYEPGSKKPIYSELPRTIAVAWQMFDQVDLCSVSDPDYPEGSYPAFVAEHVDIREQFNEWLASRLEERLRA